MIAPVRLDPFRNIVNVGWGVSGVLVIEFSYQKKGLHPAFTLHSIPGLGGSFNVFASDLYNSAGPIDPPAVNPVTDNMLKYLRMWNRTPKLTDDSDHIFRGTALIFMNTGKIKEFKITTPATGGNLTFPGSTSYYVWFDFGDPFPGTPPNDHAANISYDSVWGTFALAQARADELNAHSAYHVEAESGSPTTTPDTLTWATRISTYKTKRNFPSDADVNPLWNVLVEADEVDTNGANGSTLAPIPSYLLSVKVVHGFGIEIERTP